MSLEFKTAKKSRAPITFTYDDREIKFNPPKRAVMLMPLIDGERGVAKTTSNLTATIEWFDQGLGEKDQKYFEDRLRDSEDEFDLDDLDDLISALLEEVSGRPTT